MQIKTPVPLVTVIALFAFLFGVWQIADDGIGYVRAQFASQPSMLTEVGEFKQVFAFKARYMENERQYWLAVKGDRGWTTRRVKVIYVDGIPQGVSFI